MPRILLIILIFLSSVAYAQNDDYMSCAIAGYFQGNDETFYMDLAMTVVSKEDLWERAACKERYEDGRRAAEFYRTHRELKNEGDRLIGQQVAIFRAKVRRFILEGTGM